MRQNVARADERRMEGADGPSGPPQALQGIEGQAPTGVPPGAIRL